MFNNISEIDAVSLKKLLASGEKVRLIDVREPSEMAQGVIDGAEAMPLHTVPLHIDSFKPGETIIFYCLSGARSAQACMFLQRQKAFNPAIYAVVLQVGRTQAMRLLSRATETSA